MELLDCGWWCLVLLGVGRCSNSWLPCGSVNMSGRGFDLLLGLGLATFGQGLGWPLGSMAIGLIAKDWARSEAGIELAHWEEFARRFGRSSLVFFG